MPTPDDDHVFAGWYLVYEDFISPKLGGGRERCYWQGPGSKRWGAGDEAKASAARYPNPTAAREAVIADAASWTGSTDRLGYEWIPPVIEQLHLMPAPKQLQLFPDPEAQP